MTTALDLFAGPGGWSLACRELGVDELGVEWDRAACATARAAGHKRVNGDVRLYLPPAPVDGLIASPPCQTFSSAGQQSGYAALGRILDAVPLVAQGAEPAEAVAPLFDAPEPDGLLFDDVLPRIDDGRTLLVLEPLRYVVELAPTWVALEQVPAVLPVWHAYAIELRLLGYRVAVGLLHAEQYGVPQTRTRAILLAHRRRAVKLPDPTHSRYHIDGHLDDGVLPWVSMAEALGWGMTERPYVTVAVGTAAGGTDPQVLGGSEARAVVEREREAGRWAFKASAFDIATVRPASHPAPTVMYGHAASDARWVRAPGRARADGARVDVAEAGALQGFPRDYPWQGNRSEQYQQVGDAIPPQLALACLRQVVSTR